MAKSWFLAIEAGLQAEAARETIRSSEELVRLAGERARVGVANQEDVFVAPFVVTTNDNFMGRTERRLAAMKGPTIRRGARIGGGAILCPGIEVGEEAFVGAGAVVTKNVPARTVVVGSPARVLRNVPEDELL